MHRLGRSCVVGLCGALVALGFAYSSGGVSTALAAGTPNISLTEAAPATVLYGTPATVTLTASNPAAGSWGYNLTFEDVLPAAVSYVAGSGSLGNPTILTNEPSANKTTLIWNNVSDLSPGSSAALTFQLSAATDLQPTPNLVPNDSYTDSASAYVNSAPQQVPQFSNTGVASNYTGSATASGTTALSPLQITLAPSGVLLRGVHDHQVVYTVTITNNDVHATNTIAAAVYLPAGLEDLLCGQTDNTTSAPTNPGSQDEYPGSGLLSGHTASPGASCLTPTSITTVNVDPDGGGPLPTAVYTEVQWSTLAPLLTGDSLAAGASTTLQFVVAIPIRANTMTWTGTEPTAASDNQAANLDNNSGAETQDGTALTSYGVATGVYSGMLGSGANPTQATAYDTITARDITTTKSIDKPTFVQGQSVTYTIGVALSEYRYSDATTVTDTLPSGLCPIGTVNYDAHTDSQCAPNGDEPNPAYTSVVENTDGTFTIVWDLGHLAPNGTTTVTFPAVDRIDYQDDDTNTTPTVGNDTLTNSETAAGNLSVRCEQSNPSCVAGGTPVSHDGALTVDDVNATATATQTAPGPTITKYVSANVPNGDPLDCASATYLTVGSPGYPPTYQKGDDICFQIDVSFPPGVDFKNPTVQDFLPPNTTYVAGSATTTPSNTAAAVNVTEPTAGEVQWTMGTLGTDGNLYQTPNALFEVQFAVVANADPTLGVGATFNLTQNLAKLVTTNTEGTTFAGRSLATYQLAEPVLGLTKKVVTINGLTAPSGSGDTVRGNDEVGWSLTVTNIGVVPAYDVEVWDVLPTQENCTEVSSIVPASGVCVSGANAIEWPSTAITSIAVGANTTLSYILQIRPDAAAGETFTNDAGVRSYVGEHNASGQPTNTYFPLTNIDPSVTSGEENAPAANGTANVITAVALVTKSQVTSITNSGNTNVEATIGETITYTVQVTVPHNTTFYTASLADPLGTNQNYVTASGVVTLPSGTSYPEGTTIPGGFTYTYTAGTNTVSFTFPATYANLTATDQEFEIAFSVVVNGIAANKRNTNITNVATLTNHGSIGQVITSSNTPLKTLIVEPDMAITKSASSTTLTPNGTLTYSIALNNVNTTAVSPAFDLVGQDPIPTGVTYVPGSASLAGPAPGTVGFSAGAVDWTIPGPLFAGQTDTVTFVVVPVSSSLLSIGQVITNTATLTSWDNIGGGPPTPPGARTYGPLSSTKAVPMEFPTVLDTKTTPNGSVAYSNVPFEWSFTATNTNGAANADTVDATDTLPPNWTYDPGTATIAFPTGPNGHADPTVTPNASGDVLYWGGLGTLAPGQAVTITYEATPTLAAQTTPGTGPTNPHTNTVFSTWTDDSGATGTLSGPYTSANATAQAFIGRADLQITKSHAGTFAAGASGTYTLSVVNNGPSTAASPLVVTDAIPTGESFVSATGTSWTCIFSAGTVACTYGSGLASGATANPISLVVSTPANTVDGTVIDNTASVTSPTYDNNLGNNSSTDPTTIDSSADLQITKSHVGSFTAGGSGTYTISVQNHGPSDAQAPLTMVDTLPSTETLVSASGSGWVCGAQVGLQFTCTDSTTLTAGSFTSPITVVVDVAATQGPGNITNTATIGSPTTDPNPANNTSANVTSIQTSADLAFTKVHVGTFKAGTNGVYDFTITNDGPSDAAGPLTITDALPTGETFVSISAGWTCNLVAGSEVCTDPAGLANGGTDTLSMTVAIASSVTVATLSNTATVGSPTTDPNPGNNTSTDVAGTTQSADVSIVKTLTSSLVAGENATYSLQVANAGPSDAAATLTVTDTLPGNEGFVSAIGTGWICNFAGGVVTCTKATPLTAGTSANVITLTVSLASSVVPQTIVNTASVSSPTPDPVSANNVSTTSNTSTTQADLRIVKTDNGPFVSGDSYAYTLAVSNLGPSDAAGPITVIDDLPSGETYVSSAGSGWSCVAISEDLSCTQSGVLAAGQNEPGLVLNVTLAPSFVGASISNTAMVSSSTLDPHLANNTSTDVTPVSQSADVRIVKSHTGNFDAGTTDDTYTLQVSNLGPSDSQLPLVVTDTVPVPENLVSANGGSGWSCSTLASTVTCDATSPLAAGAAAAPISVVVGIGAGELDQTVDNTAVVTPTTSDPVSSNNSSTDPTTIVAEADLDLSKASSGAFIPGDDADYVITIVNNGAGDAAGPLTVTDTLPAGETFVAGTGTGWSCSAVAQDVSCAQVSGLPDTQTAPLLTLEVALASSDSGTLTNSATVSSPTLDPDPSNNTGSVSVVVSLESDLQLSKSHGGVSFVAGADATYFLAVTNEGASDEGAGIVVTDTLPAGETFVSGVGMGWTCSAAAQVVTCTDAQPLPNGASATVIDLNVFVASSVGPTIVNTAMVAGPNPDPNPTNNTASDTATVVRDYNLSLTKTIDGELVAGSDATYTITIKNSGPSDSMTPLVMVDDLPAGLVYAGATSKTSGTWTCTVAGQTVTCTDSAATLGVGVTSVLLISVRVTADAGTHVDNVATVGGPGDTGAPAERGAVDGIVSDPATIPNAGSDFGIALPIGLLLVVLGSGSLMWSRRRKRRLI
jgi:large repetitive protein